MRKITLLLFLNLTLWGVLSAQITQWRGENRDGLFHSETGLLKAWPEGGPQLLMQTTIPGKGFSSPILVDQTIYITGMVDTLDYLFALDMQGKILWQVPYGRSWAQSYPDTRSTPTVEGELIYVLAGSGILSCFSRTDGKLVWSVDVDKEYEAEWHFWGVSESPLITGNMVICSPGGNKTSVVAFDKMTGREIWRTPAVGGPRCYISPTLYAYKDFRYILAATGQNLIAIVPETGHVAWSYQYWDGAKWDQPGLIWANTPVWKDDEIFITMGYDYRAVMLKMNPDGSGVTEKYTSTVFDNHHHGVVLVDGYLYGSNWINNGKGNWVCMDWDTGEIKWETTWENKGSVIWADGLLYLYEEKRGHVGLVNPSPEKFDLLSYFRVTEGSGPHWAHPFIRDGKLFLRHGEALMVYQVR